MNTCTRLIIAVATLPLAVSTMGLPRDYTLFGDRKSHQADDLITVLVDESNTAQNNAQTTTSTENKGTMGITKGSGALGFVPSMGAGAEMGADYSGQGKTSRAGSVSAVVGARVMQVLANGNLVIEGSKQVVINEETEVLTVAGVVRPEDIGADNTVRSSRMSDARIAYAGRGTTSSAEKPGLIARFFNWLF